MKTILFIVSILIGSGSKAQVAPFSQEFEQSLEDQASKDDAPTEDDSYLESLDLLRKHPLNINQVNSEDLEGLGLLTDLQISSFIRYRSLLGELISMYELQAVPGWDPETIRSVRPYIRLDDGQLGFVGFGRRLKEGEQSILFRCSAAVEKSKGYQKPTDTSASYYLGSPERIFFRYTYTYKRLLHFGILGDKDAGEQFLKGSQPYGFDFYSFHFFIGQFGIIKALVIGDFTINLGQGLIQWQGLAFSKSSNVLAIKREGPVLQAYHSAGEYNFHRGFGISLGKKSWSAAFFLSARKLDANLSPDTLSREDIISSFGTSGYHRTKNELVGKGNSSQISQGVQLSFSKNGSHLGFNAIGHQFAKPIQHQDLPYNLYSIRGQSWWNASVDYSFAWKNIHVFGEFAIDRNFQKAGLSGALISLGQSAGLGFVYRNLSPEYQALNGNAFTESINPSNENGFYSGLTIQPGRGWQFDFFFDVFAFPWLKYRVDAPGFGRDFLVQAIYRPTKDLTLISRFRNDAKSANGSIAISGNHPVYLEPKRDWRTEISVSINKEINIRSRLELLWIRDHSGHFNQGFLSLFEIYFHLRANSVSGNFCMQYFETSAYTSRIYVYESDLLYSMSLPVYYNRGYHYYVNVQARLNQVFRGLRKMKPELGFWLRWGQTLYKNLGEIGTGLDEISGNVKSEWKFQIFVNW